MPRFLRCFFTVIYLQVLGIAVVRLLLWVTGNLNGSNLSIGAMLFGRALGVSWAIYEGEFIDHCRYVKASHRIHKNPDETRR